MKGRTIQSTIVDCAETTKSPRWLIWISPRYSKGSTISTWLLSCKWNNLLYRSPCAVVQLNGNRPVRQRCPLLPLLYYLALESLLRRLKDRACSPTLYDIDLLRGARIRVPTYDDNVAIFLRRVAATSSWCWSRLNGTRRLRGPRLTRQVFGFRLSSWRGSPVCIPGVWFGTDLLLQWNWLEVEAKVGVRSELGSEGGCHWR